MIEHHLECEVRFEHPATFEVIGHPIENIRHQIHQVPLLINLVVLGGFGQICDMQTAEAIQSIVVLFVS